MPVRSSVFSLFGIGFVSYCCTLVAAESNGQCSIVMTVSSGMHWSLVIVSVCKVFLNLLIFFSFKKKHTKRRK